MLGIAISGGSAHCCLCLYHWYTLFYVYYAFVTSHSLPNIFNICVTYLFFQNSHESAEKMYWARQAVPHRSDRGQWCAVSFMTDSAEPLRHNE